MLRMSLGSFSQPLALLDSICEELNDENGLDSLLLQLFPDPSEGKMPRLEV